jgi:hypothetical protein
MTVVPWSVIGEAGMLLGLTFLIPAVPYTIAVYVIVGIIPGGLGALVEATADG